MICQLHIIILCKSGEPKRYTNYISVQNYSIIFIFAESFFAKT